MNEIDKFLWEYVRGDLTNEQFEEVIYSDETYKGYFDDEFYFDIINNDYKNNDTTYQIKERIKLLLEKNNPAKCKCIGIKNLTVLDMFDAINSEFKTFNRIIDRGKAYWWLYLSLCQNCNQYWMIAQEERINDVFIMKRLSNEIVNKILNDNEWPNDFDKYENLICIGKEAGYSYRFYEPEKSIILPEMIKDLAIDNPGIKLSRICALLNLEKEIAFRISKKVLKSKNIEIDLYQ